MVGMARAAFSIMARTTVVARSRMMRSDRLQRSVPHHCAAQAVMLDIVRQQDLAVGHRRQCRSGQPPRPSPPSVEASKGQGQKRPCTMAPY